MVWWYYYDAQLYRFTKLSIAGMLCYAMGCYASITFNSNIRLEIMHVHNTMAVLETMDGYGWGSIKTITASISEL